MKFFIKDLFSECDKIRKKLRIFCAVLLFVDDYLMGHNQQKVRQNSKAKLYYTLRSPGSIQEEWV